MPALAPSRLKTLCEASFALVIQDQDEVIGTAVMPYTEHVKGVVGLNYQAEPLRERSTSTTKVRAPLLEAFAGDLVKIRLVLPWSEQAEVFNLEGHRWPFEPGRQGKQSSFLHPGWAEWRR